MRNFDPTPPGVTYFRINAIGFAASIFAMFAAIYWWMGLENPQIYHPIVMGLVGVSALFTSALYFVPAFVPRRKWGYIVGWIQIAFSVTSMTATLPTIAVILSFARDEVKDWFEGRPVGFEPGKGTPNKAIITALVGYYVLVSALPFGFAYLLRPDQNDHAVVQTISSGEHHVTFDRHFLEEKSEIAAPEEFEATTLTSGTEWKLSDQTKPVAVTVWATYCGSCGRQMEAIADAPELIGTQTKHVTLALDCEKNGRDHRRHVRSKLGQSGITSEALCATGDSLDVDGLPTTVFFDDDGRRRATAVGFHSYETLDEVAEAVEQP